MQTLSINQTEMNKPGSLRIAFFLSPSKKRFFKEFCWKLFYWHTMKYKNYLLSIMKELRVLSWLNCYYNTDLNYCSETFWKFQHVEVHTLSFRSHADTCQPLMRRWSLRVNCLTFIYSLVILIKTCKVSLTSVFSSPCAHQVPNIRATNIIIL